MQEIHIADRLVEHRRKKGIRQEELAQFLGVSKAAVSKWESDRSYPDITLLPQLAAYFNISVDELLGYEPQMLREDIRRLYRRLAAAFASRPFAEVRAECNDILQKYYACFPLLLQMAVLLMNHAQLADDPGEVLEQAAGLAGRVKTESDDVHDAKQGALLEAACRLLLRQPERALELQDEQVRPMLQDTELLAQTYQALGDADKAGRVWQISLYQHVVALVGGAANLLLLYAGDREKSGEILRRAEGVIALFQVERLHPNAVAGLYLTAAQLACTRGDLDRALDHLSRYADLCPRFFPCVLHGDDFFDALDDWFAEFALGSDAPREEKLIRASMLQAVRDQPIFAPLAGLPRFQGILDRIARSLEL